MIVVIVIMVVIALIDVPPMLKARPRNTRTIITYATLYVFVMTFVLLLIAGVKLPVPMLVLGKIFKSIGLSY